MKLPKIPEFDFTDRTFLKGLSYVFNTFMVITEIFYLIVFVKYEVKPLIWVVLLNFTLSTLSYFLIKKMQLYAWVCIVYFICIDILTIGTIVLGFGYGFQYFSISLITIAFYIYYISAKLFNRKIDPFLFTVFLIVVLYFVSYGINQILGNLYAINPVIERIFFIYNSMTVFFLLISYMGLYIRTIFEKEKQLEQMALVDKLTGLYNRHYLLSYIENIEPEQIDDYWVAIIDIDNFKKVNDVYGHNCGDHVLRTVASTTMSVCEKCTVCRWGGEEFVILAPQSDQKVMILETLREKIAATLMSYEDQNLYITVTIGTEKYSDKYNTDQWIDAADSKLYIGKNNGKNQVVW